MITTLVSHLPPFVAGYGGIILTAMQAVATLSSYSNETNPTTRTPYSKFAPAAAAAGGNFMMVSSRTGMMIIYAPAFLVSSILMAASAASGGGLFATTIPYLDVNSALALLPTVSPAGLMCVVHFAKRVLEVQFLHRYSGHVELNTSAFIGTYYALISILICCIATSAPSETTLAVGMALFAIGLGGNYYHHSLLAQLRRAGGGKQQAKTNGNGEAAVKQQRRYSAPQGGFFEYVAAPHYLFELIGWLGIAVVAGHGNAYLVFTSMGSYLGGRAVGQNEWNKKQFPEEWDESRKSIIPFVF